MREVSILLHFISTSGLTNKFYEIVLFSDAYLKDAFRLLSSFLYIIVNLSMIPALLSLLIT